MVDLQISAAFIERRSIAVCGALLLVTAPLAATADVVVLTNRTRAAQSVETTTAETPARQFVLAPGDSRPVFSDQPVLVRFGPIGDFQDRTLDLNTVHYLTEDAQHGISLRKIDLGEGAGPAPTRRWPPHGEARGELGDLPVMLCVDDEEPTRDEVWQARLHSRATKASQILKDHTGTGLRIVGFARWISSSHPPDFAATIAEFERTVQPPTGAVAIGFTSQHHVVTHKRRLGGTRGPLRSHILLREWSPSLGETERVELLVHELGHYFGAAHSPELGSVMRPTLTNETTRLKSHTTRFDALNTLAAATLAEERRRRGATTLGQVSPVALRRLDQIYDTLYEALPHDPGAAVMSRRFDGARGAPEGRVTTEPITDLVINLSGPRGDRRAHGDELTNQIVRAAAGLVSSREDQDTQKEYLLLLGFVMDDTDALVKHPRTSGFAQTLDPPASRALRRRTLNKPTAMGRGDTAKHFFVSAALTAASSSGEALAWGDAKEVLDAQGGTGFSFADIAANRAGVRFAESVLRGELPLRVLSERFMVEHFIPSIEDLPEGLQAPEFIQRYGGIGDRRFSQEIERIDRRIDALPPYTRLSIP